MPDVRTIEFSEFTDGIDRRTGIITRGATKLYDGENIVLTNGKTIQRRPPAEELPGVVDIASSQNLIYVNGKYLTVAKAGTTVSHTVSGITVETIYFDNPEYATDWELISLFSASEVVVALIKHAIPGVQSRLMWHVWDDTRPTWVEDPAAPTNWYPSLPLHANGKGTVGTWKDYTPAVAISADKILCTLPDGNTKFGATNRPRVWNERSAQDILDNGRWFYWMMPTVVGSAEFVIPIPYSEFVQDGRMAAYVLERCQDDGNWTQFIETGLPLSSGEYSISATTNRFDATKPEETKITIAPGISAGRIIRFRAFAKSPVNVELGCYLTPSGSVVGGIVTHQGASHDITTAAITPLTGSTDYFAAVIVPGAPIALSKAILGTFGGMPLNGQQRYWSRIIANARTNAGGTAFEFSYTGTVEVKAGGNIVIGTGTAFLSQAIVGRQIEVNGEKRVIKTISSDTYLEVTEPFSVAITGATALRDVRYRYAYDVGDAGNDWYASKEVEAAVTLAGSGDCGQLNTSLYDNSGSVPTALGAAQNRLLVLYTESVQLWQTDQDPKNMRHLSTDGLGSGPFTNPASAIVNGYTVLPTHEGPTMFSPDGTNKDYLKFDAIGGRLRGITLPNFDRAAWWPALNAYVTACSTDPRIFCFSYHQDEKVHGWSTWTVRGLTRIDSMFVAGKYLCVLCGNKVWRFDSLGTRFRDSSDTDTPFLSRSRWLYNNFGQPSKTKKITRADINQTGKSFMLVYVAPSATDAYSVGPTMHGVTSGQQRFAVSLHAPAIGVEIQSRDETGNEIFSFGFDYQILKR